MNLWRMKYLIAALTVMAACGSALGPGGFSVDTIRVGKGAGSVESADFNKDGYPDIVVANEEDSSVTILINDGKGRFRPAEGSPFFANRNPNDICIADVNHDGNPDLGIANTEVSMLTLLLGNGKGRFGQARTSPYPVHSKPHTHGVAIADFNGDGNKDMATDNWGHNQILVLFGDSSLHFGGETFFDVGNRPYQRLRAGDLNGDGKADIVTTNLEGNNVTVLLGNGNGTFKEAGGSPFASGSAPFGVAIGDVNGDGFVDLAVVDAPTITSESKGEDGLWILLGDGKGAFRAMPGLPFGTGRSPSRVAIGDLDGDGVKDIAVTNYNGKSITVLYMGKPGVLRTETIGVGNHPNGICISDFNGDGRGDIAVGNGGDATVTVLVSR